MIEKEHKTIEEQIEILKGRGLIIRDEDETSLKTYLLEYGYERVITGSNSLFKTSNENKDNYDENSKAKYLMMAFDIDRNISIEIFKYLSKSGEIKINTIIANTIAGILSEKELQKNGLIFGIKDDDYQIIFTNYEKVLKNKNELPISILKKTIAGESAQNGLYDLEMQEAKKDFKKSKIINNQEKVKENIEKNIKNIKDNKKFFANSNDDNSILYLPIWKIANTWTLNSAINIFRCMAEEKQYEIIKNSCWKFSELGITPAEFIEILFWIKKFRNMLAHNYSIYKMNYVLKKTKYISYKFEEFIKKLKEAKIILREIDSINEVQTGIITFVRLLEIFLNIKENKIQEAIKEIIEDKFDKNCYVNQLKKIKTKIEKIINKKESQKDDAGQLKEVKEKIEKIIENKFNDQNELQKDEIEQLEKVKGKIKDIIYEQVYFSK